MKCKTFFPLSAVLLVCSHPAHSAPPGYEPPESATVPIIYWSHVVQEGSQPEPEPDSDKLPISDIIYGAETADGKGRWVVKSASETGSTFYCNNDTFGDPFRGIVKDCYTSIKPISSDAFKTKIADEGDEQVKLTDHYEDYIFYGAGQNWHSIKIPTSHFLFDCNNKTFSDPVEGIPKSCYLVSSQLYCGQPTESEVKEPNQVRNRYSVGTLIESEFDEKGYYCMWDENNPKCDKPNRPCFIPRPNPNPNTNE